MKRYFPLFLVFIITMNTSAQQVLHLQNGVALTVQHGAALTLLGGLTLENGSNLLNNGEVILKNNTVSNISNWTDNSLAGALNGTGIVIFNSTSPQQVTGPTQFYTIYINTEQLSLNNDLNISNVLRLIKGKINTTNYVVALINSNSSSLENDITNTGYANCWINGNLRRSIETNTSIYDFPVGNSDKSNLLQFINNNITGPSNLTASFGPKAGTDAGLNGVENGNTYTAVNNGGVWKLVPNTGATGGNYALHLYFNGFTGLADNRFGILRRSDASANAADWIVPTGSLLEALNGTGRKVSDGFARRYNISDFSQLGIGEFTLPTPCEITGQSAVCAGSPDNIYSGPPGMTTYLWSVTGATMVGSNTGQSVSITAAGGTFTLNLVTTLNGMSSQCSKTVSVSSTPTCNIIGPNELCSGSINGYLGPVNMLAYSWTTSQGLSVVGPNTNSLVSVTSSTAGPQMLTLNATGIGGCTSQCTKIIQVIPVVPCSITGASNVTSGTTNNQYAAPPNMTSYKWSITAGGGTIVGSNSGSSVNVTAGVPGSFTLTLTTTLATCSTTCSKTVTIDPTTAYSCAITGPTEVCKGSLDVFTAPSNLTSYTWSVTANASIIGSSTSSSVNVGATIPGSYSLSLQTMLNGVACSSTKTVNVIECVNACSYTQGFYGNKKGNACYYNTGISLSSSELMLNAFGVGTSQVFGNVANKRFFTLFKSDILNGAIYKMLPGGSSPADIGVDNISPFDGAYYSDEGTWSLVPLQPANPQKGRIRNSTLAQTITLWFNLRNNNSLATISLVNDTLVTQQTTSCGSGILINEPVKFGLPHSIVLYLNGGNGYPSTVAGLFALANDVLGGVTTNVTASDVTEAIDVVNAAFDGCRVLVNTIPYTNHVLTIAGRPSNRSITEVGAKALNVIAYPNPYQHRFQLIIKSPVSGMAKMEFYTLSGQRVYEMSKPLLAGSISTVLYTGSVRFSTLFYKVSIDRYVVTGIVLKPN